MALFPRKIGGRYAMIGRQDNENLYLIYSDDLYTWDGGSPFLQPKYPWEFVQIGNCGSPIELDDGWLLLTHGVGPVRKYSIGAVLLDKDDPSKSSRVRASRWFGLSRPSARAMCPMSSTRVALCDMATRLSCPMRSRTRSQILPRSRSRR